MMAKKEDAFHAILQIPSSENFVKTQNAGHYHGTKIMFSKMLRAL